MDGISQDLMKDLRKVLINCGQFKNAQELQSFFTDERLSPWRGNVPQSDNQAGLVDGVIAYLETKENNQGENALVLFLNVLQGRVHSKDACYQKLSILAQKLEREKAGLPKHVESIFLAFDSRDREIADTIVKILGEWFPKSKIFYSSKFRFGTKWREELFRILQNADLALALCTHNSIKKLWFYFEIGAFAGRNRLIIPLMVGGISPDDLPAPLKEFFACNLEVKDDVFRFVNLLAEMFDQPLPQEPEKLISAVRSVPEMGVPKKSEDRFPDLLRSLSLVPNSFANTVLEHAKHPYPLAVDDLIIMYVSPNYRGLSKHEIEQSVGGRRSLNPEVAKAAKAYRETRSDKDWNETKLALVHVTPFLQDRPCLELRFEEMSYFDFDGPRRKLYSGDTPTQFAYEHYFGKEIPGEIPTPLASVHTIVTTKDEEYLVLGLRRVRTTDFYSNKLSVGFEEQMDASDKHVFDTVKRGLHEEVGIENISDSRIKLIALGLEASFFSAALIASVSLEEFTPQEMDEWMRLHPRDHEWDPLFIPNDTRYLLKIMQLQRPTWKELNPTHFFHFDPSPVYDWHGTSRFRLFSYLARKEGVSNLSGYLDKPAM